MAAPHRRRPPALVALLEGGGVELLQAASLLSQLGRQAGRAPIGEGAAPRQEAFAYRGVPHLRFPVSEVERVEWPADAAAPPALHSAAFGLLGHHGPLPDWITEEMAQRLRRGDHAALGFLRIFEHRLFALLVRAQARLRPGFGGLAPAAGPAGRIGFALRGRLPLPDAVLLPHAGLVIGRSRSAMAMQAMLQRQLGVPVTVRPFRGRWLRIEAEDRTRIGRGGRYQHLGQGAQLGGRVWDVSSSFTIAVGPLTLTQHQALLPGGATCRALTALTRFHKTEELDFVIELTLKPEAVPVLRASTRPEQASRLGWISFLAGRQQGPATIRFRAREAA
jgi:type VI secretion system protein ImpH